MELFDRHRNNTIASCNSNPARFDEVYGILEIDDYSDRVVDFIGYFPSYDGAEQEFYRLFRERWENSYEKEEFTLDEYIRNYICPVRYKIVKLDNSTGFDIFKKIYRNQM